MTKMQVRIILYFLVFVLPILGMINCHGWSELDGKVHGCFIDFPFSRSYAEFYYALLLFSAFLLLIPMGAYVLISVAFVELLTWIWGRVFAAKSKPPPAPGS